MPAEIPDPDFEPEWLWGTRITAEAAHVSGVKGRTPRERFEIYERLISAAYKERQRRESPEHGGLIADAAASIRDNLLFNITETEESIILSGFEADDTK
jgi:hypothetical protein